ncbi:serine/threonine protein kinase, partial [Myxococcota bacterium]|nr:serine/threonine protein kinase [Myxococcota bacterium]
MSRSLPDQPELRLGKYHVVRPLKVGGTAAIYLAVMRGENGFSREVVVKRPLPHLVTDARARLMFIDEAHIASRLSHPNICQVLDLVARDDELYLVLEYLKGVDLREMLKRCVELGRFMPPEIATWIGIEVAAGLDFAHEAKALDGQHLHLVHRDVSPKNIRITDSGSVKVIDFGIARAMNRATETAAGTIKGTLGYMSPEQIMGDEIDRRSDVFAFGIVLFQMFTGRNPFDGPTLKERVRRLTHAPIPAMREYNPALDDEIEAIVARCLNRDLGERYQRMRDVQRDLDRYLARLQTSSPRQQLIQFLEEIFPNLHEADPALNVVLTEISSFSGRVDTTQRLAFPDDHEYRAASGMTFPAPGTAATQQDPRFSPTKTAPALEPADETVRPDFAGRATVRLAPRDDGSERATEESRSPPVHDRTTVLPPKDTRLPWGLAAAFAIGLTAAVAIGVATWLSDRWSSVPLVEDAGVVIAPVAPDAAAVQAGALVHTASVAARPDAGAPDA